MKKLIVAASVAGALFAQAETYTVPVGSTETVTSENAATYNAYEGVIVPSTAGLDFTGPGTTSFTVPLTVQAGGSVVVSNGADVVLGENTIDLGGEMVVTNATLRPAEPTIVTGDNWKKTLTVGAGGRGFLRIEDGALVTNRIQLGKNYSAGVVVQRGGHVVNLGSKSYSTEAERNRVAIGRDGNGYYEQRGGTNTLVGVWSLGAGYKGHGVLALYDGEINVEQGGADAALLHLYCGAEPAAYYQLGGRANLKKVYVNTWTYYAVFAVYGPDAAISGESLTAGFVSPSYSLAAPAPISFGGGASVKIGLGLNFAEADYHGVLQAVFNFDDATVIARGSWGNLFGASTPTAARYVVYKGGLKLDPNGYSSVIANTIRGATGYGVTNVVWDKTKTYSICPIIVIKETGADGKGYGASAVAKYDPVTKLVTDVVVVSPGCDYTQATAYFVYGDSKEEAVTRTDIGPNPADGGVLVESSTGGGNLYFDATGAWTGVTEVRSGTVQLRDGGLPANAALRLTGGKVNFYNKRAQTFRSIGGTSGEFTGSPTNGYEVACLDIDTARTLDLSQLTLTVTGRWDVAAADLAAGKFADYNVKELVFAEGSKLSVSGTPDPTAVKRMTLLKATKLTGQPEFEDEAMNQNWKLVRKNNQLDLVYKSGLMLIFR